MKLYILSLLTLLLSFSSLANCEKDYKKHLYLAPAEVLASPAISGGLSSGGSSVSLATSLAGTPGLNIELSLAGTLYGAAFTYEGQYVISNSISMIRNYKGRIKAYLLLRELPLGTGDEIEELIDLIEAEMDISYPPSRDQVLELIIQANEDKTFCRDREVIYTFNNIKNFIIQHFLSIDRNVDYGDQNDLDDDIDIIP